MRNIHIDTKFNNVILNLGKATLVEVSFSGISLRYDGDTQKVYNDVEDAYKLPELLRVAGLFQLNDTTFVNLDNVRGVWIPVNEVPTDPDASVLALFDLGGVDSWPVEMKYRDYKRLAEACAVTLH